MEKKTKNWISNFAISAFSVAALVAPIATTVAYQSKTAAKVPAGINASEEVAAASVYTTPQNLPTHFENSLEGFKGIYQTLERLYPEIKVDYTKLEAFYNAYRAKANNLIAFANVNLTHRSFWSSIWDGIKGVGEAIAGGFVKVADVVTGGQIADVHNAANTLINAASDSFKDATEEMNKVDWASIGAWWAGLGTKALSTIEFVSTGQNTLTGLAERSQVNNVLIPLIKEKIAEEATNYVDQNFRDAISGLGINMADIIVVSEYSGSEKPNIEITHHLDAGVMADYLYGKYEFRVTIDFTKTNKLTNEQAVSYNAIAEKQSAPKIVAVDIRS